MSSSTTHSAGIAPFPLQHGEVDGVRTLVADLAVDPTITLLFGVGYVDATPATAGITHLVEHLVMRRVGYVAVTNNAESGLLWTSFYAVGAPSDRADFVRRVCAAITGLADITDADLDVERQAILAEIGPAAIYAARDPFSVRYGTAGLGVTSVTHARLLDWSAAEVRAAAAAWFHRGNAYLLSTTALPEGLSLPLPEARPVVRAPQPAPLLHGRAVADVLSEGLTLSGTCATAVDDTRRTVASSLLRDVLHDALRIVSGQVYAVDMAVMQAGQSHETWAVTTEPSEESVCDVLVAALDVVDRLAHDGPTAQELDRTRSRLLHELSLSSVRAGWLDTYAVRTLRGVDVSSVEDAARVTAAVTPEEVRAAVAQFAASLLVTLPAGHVPHEAAAARLDSFTYAEPHPDPEGRTGTELARAVTVSSDRSRLVSALVGGTTFYPGKLFSPARGLRVAILADRFVLLMPDAIWVIPFADVVLVGTDRDGDIEIVTSRGGVVVLRPEHFRGLAEPLAFALDRLPHAVRYTKDRVRSALPDAG